MEFKDYARDARSILVDGLKDAAQVASTVGLITLFGSIGYSVYQRTQQQSPEEPKGTQS